jgi:hypothetical protein
MCNKQTEQVPVEKYVYTKIGEIEKNSRTVIPARKSGEEKMPVVFSRLVGRLTRQGAVSKIIFPFNSEARDIDLELANEAVTRLL